MKVDRQRIEALHGAVWTFRARMEQESNWVTPVPFDAMLFAITESGEALKAALVFSTQAVDARLRTNPIYVRNNQKPETMEHELAQTALMLLTALGPDLGAFGVPDIQKYDLVLVVERTLSATLACRNTHVSDTVWRREAVEALCIIVLLVPDLETQLDEVLAKFVAKHLNPPDPSVSYATSSEKWYGAKELTDE